MLHLYFCDIFTTISENINPKSLVLSKIISPATRTLHKLYNNVSKDHRQSHRLYIKDGRSSRIKRFELFDNKTQRRQ